MIGRIFGGEICNIMLSRWEYLMHTNEIVLTFEGVDIIHGISDINNKEPWFCEIYVLVSLHMNI